MKRFAYPLLLCFACTDPRTTVAVARCGELPPTQQLSEWNHRPLFAPTTRAVTLSYATSTGLFVAYGIDVDAQSVVWVMSGPLAARDGFIAENDSLSTSLGVASTITFKGGGGPSPGPSGGDPSPDGLVTVATAMASAAVDPGTCDPTGP